MGAKHNVIQLETQRQDIKTKAASNPRGLLLGLCIASVVAVAATTAAAVVVVVIGNKLGSPQFRKKVKFCNCCSTALQQHHSHSWWMNQSAQAGGLRNLYLSFSLCPPHALACLITRFVSIMEATASTTGKLETPPPPPPLPAATTGSSFACNLGFALENAIRLDKRPQRTAVAAAAALLTPSLSRALLPPTVRAQSAWCDSTMRLGIFLRSASTAVAQWLLFTPFVCNFPIENSHTQ